MGHSTNNVVELYDLIKGLQIMISLKINSLIVEGGSTLIITFLSHL